METKIKREEIIEAFNRLQSDIYYNKTNLSLRYKMSEFCDDKNIKNKLTEILKFLNEQKSIDYENLFKEISIELYNKKLKKEKSISNFITNNNNEKKYTIERLFIFASFPIEFHIIAVLWIQKYGPIVEKRLSKCCYGNRLAIDEKNKNKLINGNFIYKRYIKQYHDWWNNGLEKANSILKEDKKNINILNLDISNFYHNINFKFEDLEEDIIEIDTEKIFDKDSILHRTLKKIHEKYFEIIKENNIKAIINDGNPLPISLETSSLFANWYLYKFDTYIEDTYKPIYYGRYVDDIMLINSYRKSETVQNDLDILDIIENKFPNLINCEKGIYKFNIINKDKNKIIPQLDNLEINKDKIFLYDFDAELPLNIIEKFIEDQKIKSSEYKFLSDEEDLFFNGFDEVNFIQTIENLDGDKARIKQV